VICLAAGVAFPTRFCGRCQANIERRKMSFNRLEPSNNNKIDKYSMYIGQHTHIFYPFAIETAGTWHEMAIELTQEIGRRINTITEDTRETTFLFQRLSVALQRGNAISFHNTMVTE